MPLGVAVHKLEARRQVIDALQFELRTARGKIDDLAFDRLRIRTEQESPARGTNPFGATRNQRRLSDPLMRSFVINPANVYNPLINDLLHRQR